MHVYRDGVTILEMSRSNFFAMLSAIDYQVVKMEKLDEDIYAFVLRDDPLKIVIRCRVLQETEE